MNIGLDFDGTITRHPKELMEVTRALMIASHNIWILTAAAGELPRDKRPYEVMKRLMALGWQGGMHYTGIKCVEGCEKGRACAQMKIDIMIDDTPEYLRHIQLDSKRTIKLLVLP